MINRTTHDRTAPALTADPLLVRIRLGAAAAGALLLLVFAPGCEGDDGGDPVLLSDEPPSLAVLPPRLLLRAGDSGTAEVRVQPAVTVEVVDPDPSGIGAPTQTSDTTVMLEAPTRPQGAANDDPAMGSLTVMTTMQTEPGQFLVSLRAGGQSAGSPEASASLEVIVLPAGDPPSGLEQNGIGVAAGASFSMALLADGSVWTWGDNNLGQLGDGTFVSRPRPVRVLGLPGPATQIAAGDAHALALLSDGSLWSWGSDDEGQRADAQNTVDAGLAPTQAGSIRQSDPPFSPVFVTDWVAVAAGSRHTLAVRSNGELWSWGDSESGQADGSDPTVPVVLTTPVRAGSGQDAIAGGGDHTLAILDNGIVEGLGNGSRGQLGSQTSADVNATPVLVGPTTNFVSVAAGRDHSLFIVDDGALFALGGNAFGQLGDGSLGSRDTFGQPASITSPVLQARGGVNFSLALEVTGTVHGWGRNNRGQVGVNGDPEQQRVPVSVGGLPPIEAIDAGASHGLALDSECGKVWAWGDNPLGQLGDGVPSYPDDDRAQPVPVFGVGEANRDPSCQVSVSVVSLGTGSGLINAAPTLTNVDCADQACVVAVGTDQSLTLSAQPNAGSAFAGWSGDCAGPNAGNPTITVVAGRSLNCFAEFTAEALPVTCAVFSQQSADFLECSFDEAGSVCMFYVRFSSGNAEESCGDHCENLGGNCIGSADEASEVGPGRCQGSGFVSDCAEEYGSAICTCSLPSSSESTCADPLEVRLEVRDASPQCETVFQDATGSYREIEVAQQRVTVGFEATHPSTARWAVNVQTLDNPQYEDSVLGQQTLDLFPGTPFGVAVEVTDTCIPARVAEDLIIVRWDDGVCE